MPLRINLYSHGLKTGPLPKGMDLYIDCRAFPDPSRTKGSPAGGGQEEKVQKWIEGEYGKLSGFSMKNHLVRMILDTIYSIPGRRPGIDVKQLNICCFCAWGMHRSPATKHLLAKWLSPLYETEVK